MLTLEKEIAVAMLEELVAYGVTDYCIAPGGRNAPLVALLKHEPQLNKTYFNDERCAVFFALGKSRRLGQPVAVIVTSGTAVAHLLAGAMEAYYTGVPLVLITADRPRRFRGSNAPQACEQVGIFGQYAPCQLDLEEGDAVSLAAWDRHRPLHLNICLEEPKDEELAKKSRLQPRAYVPLEASEEMGETTEALATFLKQSRNPFVVVSTLKEEAREAAVQFLLKLEAPVYLEAISGLREEPRLRPLAVAEWGKRPIDAVLRIGGVPTARFWRDLEERQGQIPVFSLSEVPFSGLSWGSVCCVNLKKFFEKFKPPAFSFVKSIEPHILYEQEPTAEPSLIHVLSRRIPQEALIFLGQSLPIRTWDLAACRDIPHPYVFASRGLNGIDGQLSTFLGLSNPDRENWAILGDLTALHDLGGWWVLPQLQGSFKVVVVNNGGGKIFSRMFSDKEIQNQHQLHFEPLAKMWGVSYVRWETIPEKLPKDERILIELCPDEVATNRFWKTYR